MSLYTERHGMRIPIAKTYDISIKMYSLLFDCCTKFLDNLAWKYPAECPDGRGCCGIDWLKFNEYMEYEIPTIFRRDGIIDKPHEIKNVFDDETIVDEYNQYAIFDLIEYIAQNIRDMTKKEFHSYYGHYDISFGSTNSVANNFADEINAIFRKTGLLYQLTSDYEVERIEDSGILSADIEENTNKITEPGLKDLLQTAIKKHKSPYPQDQRDAVEKIWDALERMKSYYAESKNKKKNSIERILQDMSHDDSYFKKLFEDEMKLLTDEIGNKCNIRHSEVYQQNIIDEKYYDYFFNRCLSLIALAIQYLE